jgi:hypothetical protein
MMRTLPIAAVVLLHAAVLVSASEDMQMAFRTVEYNLDASNSVVVGVDYLYGQASVVLGPRRLARVEIEWDGTVITVPTNILTHIANPRLDTIDVRVGAYWGGVNSNAWYRFVDIKFEDPRTQWQPRLVHARFLFWHGKFRKLDIDGATVFRDGDEGLLLWGESYSTIESILDRMHQHRLKIQQEPYSDPFFDGGKADDQGGEAANTSLHGSTESRASAPSSAP